MRGFKRQRRAGGGETAVQLRESGGAPFGALGGYVPLGGGDTALYRTIREAVPVVDAAICKLAGCAYSARTRRRRGRLRSS